MYVYMNCNCVKKNQKRNKLIVIMLFFTVHQFTDVAHCAAHLSEHDSR